MKFSTFQPSKPNIHLLVSLPAPVVETLTSLSCPLLLASFEYHKSNLSGFHSLLLNSKQTNSPLIFIYYCNIFRALLSGGLNYVIKEIPSHFPVPFPRMMNCNDMKNVRLHNKKKGKEKIRFGKLKSSSRPCFVNNWYANLSPFNEIRKGDPRFAFINHFCYCFSRLRVAISIN